MSRFLSENVAYMKRRNKISIFFQNDHVYTYIYIVFHTNQVDLCREFRVYNTVEILDIYKVSEIQQFWVRLRTHKLGQKIHSVPVENTRSKPALIDIGVSNPR